MPDRIDPQAASDLVFMALTVWREARGESFVAQAAVAHSILNRVHRPSWWGRSVIEVVTKRLQYSSLTDPHDPQLTTWPRGTEQSWTDALRIAAGVLDGTIKNPVPGADSYFDVSIAAPPWATSACFVAQVGRLRFFDVDHDTERAA